MTPWPLGSEMSASEVGLESLGGGGAKAVLRKEAGLPSGEPRGWGC